jgi:predicted kinase
LGAACVIAHCAAPEASLRQRVAARAARSDDASEAGIAVLERQLASAQPLAAGEQVMAVTVDTETADGMQRGLDEIVARLTQEVRMRRIDIFNGDADGLCALRQLRLPNPPRRSCDQ